MAAGSRCAPPSGSLTILSMKPRAFRPGHAKVSEDLLLGIASLLMADHDHRLAVETGKTSDDRRVVRKRAVAVQFLEIGKQRGGVIERVRTLRMPSHLSDLPRRELSIDLSGERGALFLQALDFLRDVSRRVVLREAQLLDFRLQLGDRLLEIEKRRFHRKIPKKQVIVPESREPPLSRPPEIQYSTGTGSRLRQRYQVATERQGSQTEASLRIVRSDTERPRK